MANDFIEKEFTKVYEDKQYEAPLNMAMGAACIAANFKAYNLKVLNMGQKSSLADFFVLASASNLTQAQSMCDEIIRLSKKTGNQPISVEGYREGEWVLMDLGDIIVHVFTEETRDIFNLDGLFKDVPQIEIPNEFYYGQAEQDKVETEAKDYF